MHGFDWTLSETKIQIIVSKKLKSIYSSQGVFEEF